MSPFSISTKVLITEDDADFRETLAEMLSRKGYDVLKAGDGAAAASLLAQADILLTDVRLPDTTGLDLLRQARETAPSMPVIVMTGYGSIKDAVEAMRLGAFTYLTKPFEPEELLLHLRQVDEVLRLRRAAARRSGRGDLIGSGRAMRRVYEAIDSAVLSQAPVLITGETGTGKELAARAIHMLSRRARQPFLAVNLGALSAELMESELFGHERGAFTGAASRKLGRFSLAGEGTLLLDEVGTLPLALQPKLLRALETREFWPLGAEKALPLKARLLAATNADLPGLIAEGNFRQDLYFRLDVLKVSLPPLREHPEDIPAIAAALTERMRDENEAEFHPIEVSPEALALLVTQPWPGNVRELGNTLEKGLARARTRGGAFGITAEDLNLSTADPTLEMAFKEGRAFAADAWSRKAIAAALAASEGNVTHAAERLRMNTSALFRLIKRYGLKS